MIKNIKNLLKYTDSNKGLVIATSYNEEATFVKLFFSLGNLYAKKSEIEKEEQIYTYEIKVKKDNVVFIINTFDRKGYKDFYSFTFDYEVLDNFTKKCIQEAISTYLDQNASMLYDNYKKRKEEKKALKFRKKKFSL